MQSAALLLTLRGKAKDIGFVELANRTGLNRETLYRTLSRRGNPRMATLIKVCAALGVQLSVRIQQDMDLTPRVEGASQAIGVG